MRKGSNQYLKALIEWMEEGVMAPRITGLSGPSLSYFLSEFAGSLERPLLIVLPDKKQAASLYKEMGFFMSNADFQAEPDMVRLHEFPPYDVSPLKGLSPHSELVARRVRSLYSLLSSRNPIIVSSLEAVTFRILPHESFMDSIEFLELGDEVERAQFLNGLQARGYKSTSLVEDIGEYSVRGGVIDLFCPLYPRPIRLEFWGDQIESIRLFDPVSQRSETHLDEVVICPANEIIMGDENVERARSMGRLPKSRDGEKGFPGQEAWLNHFYPHLDTLFDYIPSLGLVAFVEPHRSESILEKLRDRSLRDLNRLHQEAAEKGGPFPETRGIFVPVNEFLERLKEYQRIEFCEVEVVDHDETRKTMAIGSGFKDEEDLSLNLSTKGKVSLAPLAQRIGTWIDRGARVVMVSRTDQQANRIQEILANYDLPSDGIVKFWKDIPTGPGLTFCLGRLPKGFAWEDLGLCVVAEDEVFGPKTDRGKRKKPLSEKALTWTGLGEIKEGELVVHEDHGVGRYLGLTKMEINDTVNDFVIIKYSGNDRLYIPADRIGVVQKYIGPDGAAPRLDQLGGNSWNAAKQKARKEIKKVAKQLVEIYALRKYNKGYSFSPPDNYYREFEATFEHEETLDQSKAIEEVLDDMTSEGVMDRLICGDVGFGKTEVAMRAAFKAVLDGKQVALLVPTTVLAQQHYEAFRTRMDAYSVRVGMLSRFITRGRQADILAKVRSGEVDILIGTHRMLQRDVRFKDLALLIIDEEQRFGVRQKEAIKKYRALVDVLAITATPIPRTLQISMMGVRDLTLINTPPEDRMAIETYLCSYDQSTIAKAICFELERGGQVFFVHNNVQTIDYVCDQLRGLVPEARFSVGHGQMREKELESTMWGFLNKEIDVLVCTTIIESGLDIPSANTVIINGVERFGLAQIYQLRGRVGRSKEKAYAYLILSDGSDLTRDAEKRLKALMDFSHLGAGLHLAMHDLEIRGAGSILGFSQSGHVSAIGYELYAKMIEREIAQLKGEEWKEEINPEINLGMAAFLPGEYVKDKGVRVNLYRRLSNVCQKQELEALETEIRDRFGPLPKEVQNLLDLMSLRYLLKKKEIGRLDAGKGRLYLTFSFQNAQGLDSLRALADNNPEKYEVLPPNRLKVYVGSEGALNDISQIERTIQGVEIPSLPPSCL